MFILVLWRECFCGTHQEYSTSIWDDPAHPSTLKKVLVSTFQGGGKQSKASGNELPLTTFLLTVNFRLDDDIRFVEKHTGRQ